MLVHDLLVGMLFKWKGKKKVIIAMTLFSMARKF